MWPFRSKAAASKRTAPSFLLGVGSGRSLTGASFERLAKEGYAENAIVNACVNKVVNAAASVEWKLYKKAKGKTTEIEAHEILDLINAPNPSQSGKDFIRALASYYLLSGEAFVYGTGLQNNPNKKPNELQLLNPGKVQIKAGKSIFPEKYEYRPDASTINEFPVDQITGRSAIMQIKTFNPVDAWRGMPPMLAATRGIDIFNSGQEWNRQLIQNDARPAGLLIAEGSNGEQVSLTDDQRIKIQQDVSDLFSGTGNAGRPLILEGGFKYQQLSTNPKDMDFLEGKHSSARDIGLVFGVPSQLLGIPGDSTFANMEQATLTFWTDTVLPFIGIMLEGFNRWLTPLYGEDLFLWYDEDTIPALEPRRKAVFDRLERASFLTDDEKRKAAGYDDYKSGKSPAAVLFKPSGLVPIEMAGEMELPQDPSEPPPDDEEE